jgi:hypothetical protein
MTIGPDVRGAQSLPAVPSAVLDARARTVRATRRAYFAGALGAWVVGLGLMTYLPLEFVLLGAIGCGSAGELLRRGLILNPRINELNEQRAYAWATEHPGGTPQPVALSSNFVALLGLAAAVVTTLGSIVVAIISA